MLMISDAKNVGVLYTGVILAAIGDYANVSCRTASSSKYV